MILFPFYARIRLEIVVFKEFVSPYLRDIASNLTRDYSVGPDNVYHEGVRANRVILNSMMEQLLLPGSGLLHAEHMKQLAELSARGKACLLAVEHYGNFDFPSLYYLIEKDPLLGLSVAETVLPIKSMKLNLNEKITNPFSCSFNSIIIYPSREIDRVTDPEELKKVRAVSNPINHAAMRELTRRKYRGQIILVFPAGTRYRPWKPESKKAVREIQTYLKVFDHICFVGLNGNTLSPARSEIMGDDKVKKDIVLYNFSPVYDSKEFRKKSLRDGSSSKDSGRRVAESVMEKLNELHRQGAPVREERLRGESKPQG